MNKTALIMIDMQRGFIDPSSPICIAGAAGTTTPNCIRTTCYDALSLDYDVIVLSDCTSSVTPQVQRANLEDMQRIGAQIMTLDEIKNHS